MLVDSFSFTHDETGPSVDSQAQLLVEAGWRSPGQRVARTRRVAVARTHSSTEDLDDVLRLEEAARGRY